MTKNLGGSATHAAPTLERRELTSCFALRTGLEMVIAGAQHFVLSVPALQGGPVALQSKDLLTAGTTSTFGKYTLEEHLEHLLAHGEISRDQPKLVISLRNNLVNPRAMMILAGVAYGADGERPETSARSYFGIGFRGDRLVAEQVLGEAGSLGEASEFFVAGIPVLWDDLTGEALLDAILSEASDHSHVFEIFRGKHPRATTESRELWSRLHEVFLEHLHADRLTAAQAMRRAVAATAAPLRRCDDYLHSILGVHEEGHLVNVVAQARLEELGRMAADLGCRRAICVDNSGSVMPTFLPRGLAGESIPLLRAPNFRPHGRALLVVELADGSFEALNGA